MQGPTSVESISARRFLTAPSKPNARNLWHMDHVAGFGKAGSVKSIPI